MNLPRWLECGQHYGEPPCDLTALMWSPVQAFSRWKSWLWLSLQVSQLETSRSWSKMSTSPQPLLDSYIPCYIRKGNNTLKWNSDTIGIFLKTAYIYSDIFLLHIIVVNSVCSEGLSLRFPFSLTLRITIRVSKILFVTSSKVCVSS